MKCPILKCLPLKYRWLRKSGLTPKAALATAKVDSTKVPLKDGDKSIKVNSVAEKVTP